MQSEVADDDLLLPAADECASAWCGRPVAEHADIYHPFVEPTRAPKPERVVEALIETQWVCWSCGQDNDVWGIGLGWIECSTCGKAAFLS